MNKGKEIMKYASIKLPLFSLILIFLLSSCAAVLPDPNTLRTPEERRSARMKCIALYTVGGAAGGAGIGALIKGKKGATVGAVAGGALGFAYAWGHCLSYYSTLNSEPVTGYNETAQDIRYDPSQGYVVKIEDFSLSPSEVAQGGTVAFNGKYYVMAPEGTKDRDVTETRVLEFYDETKGEFVELGSVNRNITISPGRRSADGQFDIPEKVPDGRYLIKFIVSSNGKQDQIQRELFVRQRLAQGPAIIKQGEI
jgi:hypothetical protein